MATGITTEMYPFLSVNAHFFFWWVLFVQGLKLHLSDLKINNISRHRSKVNERWVHPIRLLIRTEYNQHAVERSIKGRRFLTVFILHFGLTTFYWLCNQRLLTRNPNHQRATLACCTWRVLAYPKYQAVLRFWICSFISFDTFQNFPWWPKYFVIHTPGSYT